MENANDEFIINNMKLVPYTINKYIKIFSNEDVNDYYQIGYIGLIKASRTFNAEKSSWCTYAVRCIINEALMYKRKNKRHDNQIYLDDFIKDSNETITYADVLCDLDTIEDVLAVEQMKVNLNIVLERQTFINKKIIKYYLKTGCKQQEIANKFGIQQSQVSRILKNYKNKVKEVNEWN